MARPQPSFLDRHPTPTSSVGDSPVDQRGDISEQPSSSSRHRAYPSWLPKRPLHPPPPASTLQSSIIGMHGDPGPSDHFIGGRKPTPRSVRIVSLQDTAEGDRERYVRREPTDQTRITNPFHPRAWSRATTAGISHTLFSTPDPYPTLQPQPRFNTTGLHPELLRNPSLKARLYFYLLPLLVFAHIPLQTFFDFNAVFILFQ